MNFNILVKLPENLIVNYLAKSDDIFQLWYQMIWPNIFLNTDFLSDSEQCGSEMCKMHGAGPLVGGIGF